jgi:hypothetical protein
MLLGAYNYKKIGLIGALPVGLKGKLYGQPFKVLVQYDAFGGVRTQIFEDETGGGMITEIRGDKSEKKNKGKAFADWAYSRYAKQNADNFPFKSADSYSIKERDSIRKDMEKRGDAFISNLVDETIKFNKGDSKVSTSKKKVSLGPTKAPARKAPAKKEPARKFKTIYVGPYLVPGYTVPKHARKIFLK